MRDDRGQVFTLEGIVTALLILSTVLFVLNATATTPLSASTANQQVETQQRTTAAGVLDAAAANDSLRPAILYWNDTAGSFHNASNQSYYTTCAFDAGFGPLLNETFETGSTACNVNLQYVSASGDLRQQRLVYVGEPTDNAARATITVTLPDDAVLRSWTGAPTETRVDNASTFYAPDADPDGPLYNVIEIEVVVWRL